MRTCRMCKSEDLKFFLDLGFHPPSDAFLTKEDLEKPETQYPLTVYMCDNCGLMQLGHVVSAKILYAERYIYDASITSTGRNHFFDMSRDICTRFKLKKESLVIDVGSNVGVLLGGFQQQGMRVLGVDPAVKVVEIANKRGIETWPFMFDYETAKKIRQEKGKASVITATNVFAHVDDLDNFMKALDYVLAEDGLYIFEVPHFIDLVNNLEYDTIYLEHLDYILIKPLIKFFRKYDMEVFDIEKYKIHGGSIRVFIGRKGRHPISNSVGEYLKLEEQEQIYSLERLRKFADDVKNHKLELLKLLHELKFQGKRIVGVSAPAKGNTLLNYCKITNEILDYLTEKLQTKVGRYSPGMHIPIVDDKKLLEDTPDYALILAWNFADEIMNNLKEYKEKGGKFIVPIPKPRIV